MLYLVFGAMLAVVSVIADYARVSCVRVTAAAWRGVAADRCSRSCARIRIGRNRPCYLLTGGLLVLLLVLYVIVDRRFGGWRGVLLGQAYICRAARHQAHVDGVSRCSCSGDSSDRSGVIARAA